MVLPFMLNILLNAAFAAVILYMSFLGETPFMARVLLWIFTITLVSNIFVVMEYLSAIVY